MNGLRYPSPKSAGCVFLVLQREDSLTSFPIMRRPVGFSIEFCVSSWCRISFPGRINPDMHHLYDR